MFEAALETIKPNFPMSILQSDPKYSNLYSNMSNGSNLRGPWNQGESTQLGETMAVYRRPYKICNGTNALLDQKPEGTNRTEKEIQRKNAQIGKDKKQVINCAAPVGGMQWNN